MRVSRRLSFLNQLFIGKSCESFLVSVMKDNSSYIFLTNAFHENK